MSADAVARERLRHRLGEVLGPAEAATLMAVLPESGAEAATTADLDDRVGLLRAEIAAQGDQLRADMAALRHELVGVFRGELMAAVTSQTRTIVYANLGLVLGSVSLALAAGRLFG